MVKVKLMEQEDLIRSKLGINDIRTIRQIIGNKELYDQVSKRDVITHKDLISEYNVADAFIKDMRRNGTVSYFTTAGTINKAQKGSKIFYFRDEMEDLLGTRVNYYPTVRVRYNMMNEFIIQVIKTFEPERHVEIFKMYLLDNKSVEQIAEELYISKERVRQMLTKTHRRTLLDLKRMAEYYPRDRDLMSLYIEREHLLNLNKQLKDKFERDKETKLRADQLAQKHVQHFLQHKLQLDLLSKKLTEYPDWMLSVRGLNCLRDAGIETLEDLLCHNVRDIRRIRNMGTKTLNEIINWLEDEFKWKMPQ
jgi:RNA polymerase sigma factor (sigma-70 family)